MPDKIVRRFQKDPFDGSPVEFLVYTRAEADREGIDYREDWWMARDIYEWVLTEDGYVEQLCYLQPIMQRESGEITWAQRFSGGMAVPTVSPVGELISGSLLYGPYKEAGKGYCTLAPWEAWHERYGRTRRAKQMVALYVRLSISSPDGKLTKKELDEVGRIRDPKAPIPRANALRFLRTTTGQMMIKKRMEDVLASLDVTPEKAIQAIVNSIEVAAAKGDARAMQTGADKLVEYLREAGFGGGRVRGMEAEWSKIDELPPAAPELPEPIKRTSDEVSK